MLFGKEKTQEARAPTLEEKVEAALADDPALLVLRRSPGARGGEAMFYLLSSRKGVVPVGGGCDNEGLSPESLIERVTRAGADWVDQRPVLDRSEMRGPQGLRFVRGLLDIPQPDAAFFRILPDIAARAGYAGREGRTIMPEDYIEIWRQLGAKTSRAQAALNPQNLTEDDCERLSALGVQVSRSRRGAASSRLEEGLREWRGNNRARMNSLLGDIRTLDGSDLGVEQKRMELMAMMVSDDADMRARAEEQTMPDPVMGADEAREMRYFLIKAETYLRWRLESVALGNADDEQCARAIIADMKAQRLEAPENGFSGTLGARRFRDDVCRGIAAAAAGVIGETLNWPTAAPVEGAGVHPGAE